MFGDVCVRVVLVLLVECLVVDVNRSACGKSQGRSISWR